MKHLHARKTTFLLCLLFCLSQSAFSVTRTWTGAVDLDFNNANNWTPVGPIANNDLIITQTPVVGTNISLSASVSINSLTMTDVNGGILQLSMLTYNLTIAGNLTANGSHVLSDVYLFQDNGALTIGGDFNWGFTGPGDCYYYSDVPNPQLLTLRGNVNIGLNGRTVATYEPDILFDGVGTQTVTLNNQGQIDGAHYFFSEDLQIGNVNTPTVVITGTYQNSGIRSYDGTTFLIKANCKLECNGSTMDKLAATASTWTAEAGSEIEINGTNNYPFGYTTYTLNPTSITEYLGTNQSITAHTYGHLQFNGSGTKTSAASFSIKGDLVTNTAFAHGNDVHWFNGTVAQNISGTVPPTFYNLMIDNSSVIGVNLFENVNVALGLYLRNGLVNTNSNILTVLNPATTSVQEYTTTDYVNTGATGTFRRYVNTTGSYDFPLGNANTASYQLMNLDLVSGNTATYFDSRYENGAVTYGSFTEGGVGYTGITLNNGGTGAGSGNANPGIWSLNPDAGTANYNITLYGRNHDNESTNHTVIKRSQTTSVIHSEDFSIGGTGTWTTSGSTAAFVFTDESADCNSYTLNSTTTANGWAIVSGDCDGTNSSVRTAYMTSPVINCSAFSNVMFSFENHYSDGNFSIAYLQKSINGGAWTNVATFNATTANAATQTYPISGAAGAALVQLRFRYDDKKTGFWAIDDIQLTGQSAPYTAWGPDGAAGTSTAVTPITAGRTGLTGFSQFAIAVGSTVLPIELLDFTATPLNKEVMLNWTTVSENDNDYFIVERSVDQENFEYVGTVQGAGNSSSTLHYELMDKTPYFGISYYRLKQVDFDGVASYSDVKSVELSLSDGEVTLYPNPVSGGEEVTLSFNTRSEGTAEVMVLDYIGRTVLHQKFPTVEGSNKLGVATDDLSTGVYIISIRQGNNEQMIRFVKR